MSLDSKNWFCKSKEESLRFYILADWIRVRNRSLGRNMKHYTGENFKVGVKLLTNGDPKVSLLRRGQEEDFQLKVALILIDENIEVLDRAPFTPLSTLSRCRLQFIKLLTVELSKCTLKHNCKYNLDIV